MLLLKLTEDLPAEPELRQNRINGSGLLLLAPALLQFKPEAHLRTLKTKLMDACSSQCVLIKSPLSAIHHSFPL